MTQGPTEAAAVDAWLQGLQDGLIEQVRTLDPSCALREDSWEYPQGGGGRSIALSDGAVFEKGGVNVSHIRGSALPEAATRRRAALKGCPFQAMGISVVFHPDNPYCPTTHMNLRYFEAQPAAEGAAVTEPVWWFGGGFDLTPFYIEEAAARRWHAAAREACHPHEAALYPPFKDACDAYFTLPHRGETRGIGGLFFDDFNALGFEDSFALARGIGEAFWPAYAQQLEGNRDRPYGAREKTFQALRRGRYVEFNLLYDRGTLFGLQSGGRTESILMSLPPVTRWAYAHTPEPGSPESALSAFLQPRDWLGLDSGAADAPQETPEG